MVIRLCILLFLIVPMLMSCSTFSKKYSSVHNSVVLEKDISNSTKVQQKLLSDEGENIQDKKVVGDEDVQPLEKEVVITPQEIEQIEKKEKVSKNIQPTEKESKIKTPTNKYFNFVLSIKDTKYTRQYFDYYSDIKRRTFQRWLKRAEPYLPYILKVFRQYNIPDDIAFLPFAESGFNPRAYSWAGAAGMWQFMRGTARKYGLSVNWWVDERLDPFRSTVAAARYLSDLYKMFGDWYLVLAAYNAGEGKVAKAIRRSKKNDFFNIAKPIYLKLETRMYVPKFMAILKIVRNLDKLGFEPICLDEKKVPARVFVREGTDLYRFSKKLGISWRKFRSLNPQFRRYVTPPDVVSSVYVPRKLEAKAKELIRTKEIRPYGGLYRYRVKRGDSWWSLSRRFGVPIKVLKRINRMSSNLIRPGRYILIPRFRRVYMARVNAHKGSSRWWIHERANYTVKKGDTIWGISKRFNVSVGTLLVANRLSKRAIIRPGMKLYIPSRDASSLKSAKKVLKQILYRVKKGDNLWGIARRFGVTTKQILSWNNLKRNSTIYPGDKLKIMIEVAGN